MTTPPATNPDASAVGRKAVSRRVRAVDRAMGLFITCGGIFVIAAVLGIFVYLTSVVLPLFERGSLGPSRAGSAGPVPAPLSVNLDEFGQTALAVDRSGAVRFILAPEGRVIEQREMLGEPGTPGVTAWSRDEAAGLVAFGFQDGTVRLGSAMLQSSPAEPALVSDSLRAAGAGASEVVRPAEAGAWPILVESLRAGQFRKTLPVVSLRAPVALSAGQGPVHALDYRRRGESEFLAVVRADGAATLDLVRTVRPLGGGEPRVRLTSYTIGFAPPASAGLPGWFFVAGDGSSVLALWPDGLLQRYATRDRSRTPLPLAEEIRVLPEGRRVTVARMLLGGQTLLAGDDSGEVRGVFSAVDPSSRTPDGLRLVVAHTIRVGDAPVRSIGISPRDRTVAIGDERGRVTVRNVTSGKLVAGPVQGPASAVAAASLSPRLDALLAVGDDGATSWWPLSPGHPEASVRSLFGRVHYEGEPAPLHRYQSIPEEVGEAKLGVIPLISGTLKATVFAMLLAAPIAVLAAVYTSEFLDRRVRAIIKPGVEIMASLPSVVLGFIAAIVVAPFIRDWLPAALLSLVVVPVVVMLGAHLWQLFPPYVTARVPPWLKLGAVLLAVSAGVGISVLAGGPLERAIFRPTADDLLVYGGSYEPVDEGERPAWVGGRQIMSPDTERRLRREGMYFRDGAVVRPVRPADPAEVGRVMQAAASLDVTAPGMRRWLDGNFGTPTPGWAVVLTLPILVLAALVHARFVKRRWEAVVFGLPWTTAAALELARFVSMVAIAVAAAAGAGAVLSRLGLDVRDLLMGPFNQRNTLVVALIMGAAIIPIIYTISEDAMRAVPDSLRSASLGAGATPWQTAVRVVLPVAGSGIFSASMIGLGRAVGETMIVVMAAGGTPTLDWSLFSGFRALSANIAIEMGEAAPGGTHYRVLFLCGLLLFALTFIINTTAEIVRQRFRARSRAL